MGDMGKEYIEMLAKASEGLGMDLTLFGFLTMLLNSVTLGTILTALTYLSNAPLLIKGENSALKPKKKLKKQIEVFIASTNILFLCVGLTGVMVLVNNNLARALAIGATLGLVRFRISLGTKMIGSNMLFGIIAGIACGLNELFVAWSVTGVYVVIQSCLLLIMRKYKIDFTEKEKKKEDKEEVDEGFDVNETEDDEQQPPTSVVH